ncbi:Predicted DNA-binding transcriptional regulator YafY, contains an HTH and WYL domains [Micromonospora rhizosphaerae]|uniref:Predicted DNA-binding transcriptional regulator YafY, contains an HTH and WYL domains n=1 Tax=Micromonospora rhizosphaerae TaxID=568872 RepID=A0A1C6RAD6_9ACTN|nr:YafY family protein [Micromonospora rhizosphaerae]SCL14080.1 Predicted DNA-binding transcriptional regulator YafY, contains an HTH and WYL domains [Micromonospora rhizosphaerae]
MRASRLISLVLLLQSRETMTATALARELEVSERTVYRDVLALSAAGVPVYADRGRAGGYRLLGGYRTRLTGLTRDEAEALFLAGLPGPAGDMGLADAVAAAELKVLAALPPSLRDAPARTGQRFHLDVPGWFREAGPPPWLTELARAVWRDRVVELRYRRGGREVARSVQPYGLVLKSGTWYLVGRVGADVRTYRVDRVVGVEVGEETFDRGEGFDLAGYWREQAEAFLRGMFTERVTVRLSPAGLRALRWAAEARFAYDEAVAAAGEPDGQGWVVTRLPVESVPVAYDVLLRLGPEVEVLDPPELRARFAEAARRSAALYAAGDPRDASAPDGSAMAAPDASRTAAVDGPGQR